MSSYSLAQFVFAPVWGRLSDRVGRRPILLLGLLGSVAGFTLFGLASTLSTLFLGRVLMGIFGATIPTAQAAVADVTAPEDRARGMGLIGAAIGLGFILGPALGGLLSNFSSVLRLPLFERNPYALPCLASAALAASNLVAAAFFLPESLPKERRGSRIAERFSRLDQISRGLIDPRVRRLLLTYFLFMLGFTMMEATLTLFIEGRIGAGDHAQLVRRVGYLFGFIGIIQVALQGGLVGRLARAFGERQLRMRLRARLRTRALASLDHEPDLPRCSGRVPGGSSRYLAVGGEPRARPRPRHGWSAVPTGGARLTICRRRGPLDCRAALRRPGPPGSGVVS